MPILIITHQMMIPLLFIISAIHTSISERTIAPDPVSESQKEDTNPVQFSLLDPNQRSGSIMLQETRVGSVLLSGNSTILSENKTFELGFFTTNGGLDYYLGIWFASIPTPTYVWVANRDISIKNLSSSRVEIDAHGGKLRVVEYRHKKESTVWKSGNAEEGRELKLEDSGNLVLLSHGGFIVWQSFNFPGDTFLPGMSITAGQSITCWKSPSDPSLGLYSLRLKPPLFGEFELVYNETEPYWSTGNWTGHTFSGVPEMTVNYIYKFWFVDPFTPHASFGYTEVSSSSPPSSPSGLVKLPFTRFSIDPSGLLRQFTWSAQTQSWNMFWSQPEDPCHVYGLCGDLGFCNRTNKRGPCTCLEGFSPLNPNRWLSGDYSGGCHRDNNNNSNNITGTVCNGDGGDMFDEIGAVDYDGEATYESISGGVSVCESSCLSNCSCIGYIHDPTNNLCRNLYGSLLNLRDLDPGDPRYEDELYLRVEKVRSSSLKTKKKFIQRRDVALILSFTVSVLSLGFVVTLLLILKKRMHNRKKKERKEEDESVFSVTNLKVFSHKELQAATKHFSEKLGHGGFGAVFRGVLTDSSAVAVKRLQRPTGGGEREFRSEVCTIGNIQHVNLVRLRGFCSEDSHRLLVYDYMSNGPLSSYLLPRGNNNGGDNSGGYGGLSWEVRFRIAIGTARGIAYLHEECRERIIHCDIKPENILLDADFTAKVSDFGLAKLIGRDFSRVLATMRGTWGYVAPEWISGVAITPKADVYSYGMTLLELIGGRRNVETPAPEECEAVEDLSAEGWFFPPWAARKIIEGDVAAVVDDRLGGACGHAEAERVGMVAVWCIQDDEDARPTMGTVVKMLEGVVEVGVPPPPKLLQALVSGESFRGFRGDYGDTAYSSDTGGTGPVKSSQFSGGSHSSMGNYYNSVAMNLND